MARIASFAFAFLALLSLTIIFQAAPTEAVATGIVSRAERAAARRAFGGTRTSNAERFARGEGPARPRRLYKGTSTNAPRAVPSGRAGDVIYGTIGVWSTTGTRLGYINADGNVVTSAASAAQMSFVMPDSYDTRIPISRGTDQLIGFGAGGSPTLAVGSYRSAVIGMASREPQYAAWTQTNIFTIDATGKISVHWVNPDGTVVEPQYLGRAGGWLYVTGDIDKFKSVTLGAVEAYMIFSENETVL